MEGIIIVTFFIVAICSTVHAERIKNQELKRWQKHCLYLETRLSQIEREKWAYIYLSQGLIEELHDSIEDYECLLDRARTRSSRHLHAYCERLKDS